MGWELIWLDGAVSGIWVSRYGTVRYSCWGSAVDYGTVFVFLGIVR